MKFFLVALLINVFSNVCFGQITNSKDQAILKNTKFIDVYKVDRSPNECYDRKNVMLVENGQISSCFRLKKKLNPKLTKKIIDILFNKYSFTSLDLNCFTTDFGMVLLDDKGRMIGDITTSLYCESLRLNNTTALTLTIKANNQLLELMR